MQNYYEKKFESLYIMFNSEIAKEKIVEELLYKSSQPKIGTYKNKFDMFWQSNFIDLLTIHNAKSENYILAMSQYIRYTITNKMMCIHYLKIDIESFILAVRCSGIILNVEHNSWCILKEIFEELNIDKLYKFMQTIEKLQQEFEYRLEQYNEIKEKLNVGQVTAMIFSSLYAYEHLIPNKEFFEHLPYQIDLNENNSAETVWKAFDEIIKTSKPNSKKLTEKSLALALKFKMMPFMVNSSMTIELKEQYECFKKLVAIKVEIINYKRNVLESFCFDRKVNYELEDNKLIYTNAKEKDDYWSQKNATLLNYWLNFGSQKLFDSEYIYRILPTGDNIEANAIALSKAFGIKEQMSQVYGINELKIDNVDLDLFDLMMTLSLSQVHYLKDHIQTFEKFLNSSNSNFEALFKLMMHGIMTGQNRMPMTFAYVNDKTKKMSSWITNGTNNQKLTQMEKILKFWTHNLYNEKDQSSYMQKPFYQIDDFIFQFPWLTAFQNLNTAMINYVRKLYKNRANLKNETDRIEINLSQKFKKAGFQVFCQYQPKEGSAGEIDLIAISGNHVLVAEVKSTYIRSSIQEIYEYKNFTLNKAAYQLSKKVEYVKSVFLREHYENIKAVKIHSWIIDTTLEFDHQYFGDHLKLSLDEIIITLNNDVNFMESIIDGSLGIGQDTSKINPFQFFELIENNVFWTKQISNYDNYIQKMLNKLAS